MPKVPSRPKSKSARTTTPRASAVRKVTARKSVALEARPKRPTGQRPSEGTVSGVARVAGIAASARIASAGRPVQTLGSVAYGLVDFSYQDVNYQIDLEKSKVYRRFIEVEKSRTSSIITAYRAILTRPRPTL